MKEQTGMPEIVLTPEQWKKLQENIYISQKPNRKTRRNKEISFKIIQKAK